MEDGGKIAWSGESPPNLILLCYPYVVFFKPQDFLFLMFLFGAKENNEWFYSTYK